MFLAIVFLCLPLSPSPSHLPLSPQHRPPPFHSTCHHPTQRQDKDNKRKFERIDILGYVQRARERMGRARMGNLEAQTVCEALGLDAQNLSADEEDKEGKEHEEDTQSQDTEEDQKGNAANDTKLPKLHQSKLSRFFASSASSTNARNNC